jgi:hypothetical protein
MQVELENVKADAKVEVNAAYRHLDEQSTEMNCLLTAANQVRHPCDQATALQFDCMISVQAQSSSAMVSKVKDVFECSLSCIFSL